MIAVEGRHFVFLVGYITQLGGAERQALLLARMLRDSCGARVSFLGWSRSPGLMTDKLEEAGIPVHIHPLDWGHRLTWRRAKLAKAARLVGFSRFVRDTVRPDYLLPYVGENSKIAGLIWKRTGARYTWWNQRDEGREIHGTRLESWLLNKVPDVVSNSWEGKDFLMRKFGLPDARVRVINNAVPLPPASDGMAWRKRLGIAEHDRLLLMTANLTRYKDHDTLLRAFAAARGSEGGERLHLALAGRSDERGVHLKAMAFDLGLGGAVHFVGPVAAMDPLYCAADVVVHSSVTEGCPNAVLEGMANGKCVIGTNISGLRQALGGDSDGFLAPPRDAEALAALIRRATSSEVLRREAGERNRARIAAEFSPEKLLDSVIAGIATFGLPE